MLGYNMSFLKKWSASFLKNVSFGQYMYEYFLKRVCTEDKLAGAKIRSLSWLQPVCRLTKIRLDQYPGCNGLTHDFDKHIILHVCNLNLTISVIHECLFPHDKVSELAPELTMLVARAVFRIFQVRDRPQQVDDFHGRFVDDGALKYNDQHH